MLSFTFFAALLLTVFFLVVLLSFLFPYFVGAPFEPMPKSRIAQIPGFARLKKSDKIVDLGSGKGDVLIELARRGYSIVGYEINPFLFLYTRLRLKALGIKNAKVYWANFWHKSLSGFDVIIIFQIGYIMKKLERKLLAECKNARVISYYWRFPGLKPLKAKNRMFLYVIRQEKENEKIKKKLNS
jgi:SAM-dependent methyltransferase